MARLVEDGAVECREEGETVARCVTCGTELHPERAEKYDYCTAPDRQEKNARSLTIAAVGVNKAADQFVILDERTEEEMASGRVPGWATRVLDLPG